MTTEDRLREAIAARTAAVDPTLDFETVRERAAVERRRRARRGLAGAGVVGIAAAVVAFVVVGGLGGDDGQRIESGPASEPTVATTDPTTATTEPPAAPAYVWTTVGATTAEEAARAFAVDYLGMVDPIVGEPAGGTVPVRPFERGPVTEVAVVEAPGGGWGVTGATTEEILVSAPEAEQTTPSPVHVAGEGRAFEGHIDVSVRDDAGAEVGEGFVTACMDVERCPFEGDVPFTTSATTGAVVLSAPSAEDGRTLYATVVAVRFESATAAAPVVAWRGDGLDLLDPATGDVRGHVPVGMGEGVNGLGVTADGTIWLSRIETGCLSRILRVPPGGAPEEVAVGWDLAVSPDGRSLAYARPRPDDCGTPFEVVVRDVGTGHEDVWSGGAGDGQVHQLSWSPDGSEVAFEVSSDDGERGEVRVLDIATMDARPLAPPDGVRWSTPVFRASGSLVVSETPAGEYVPRLVAVDPADGRRVAPLVETGARVLRLVAGPGDALVYLTEGGPEMWRWDGGEPRRLATEYSVVAWSSSA